MKLTILGSGGFRSIPRIGCHCRVCIEARQEEFRRLGPSMFVHELNILFDTPEEITLELRDEGVEKVEHIFYTHWHPDHTFGARIVEQMNTTWSGKMEWRMVSKATTTIHMPKIVREEIMERLGPFFDFWEHIGVAKVEVIEKSVKIGGLTIEPVVIETRHRTMTHSTIYILSSEGKKVIYAPCDITPFPRDDRFHGCDLMILQTGWWGEEMAERARKGPHYEISFEEILAIVREYRPGRVVLTHIGDELGMCLDDLREMEKRYQEHNIEFAYDGMEILL